VGRATASKLTQLITVWNHKSIMVRWFESNLCDFSSEALFARKTHQISKIF